MKSFEFGQFQQQHAESEKKKEKRALTPVSDADEDFDESQEPAQPMEPHEYLRSAAAIIQDIQDRDRMLSKPEMIQDEEDRERALKNLLPEEIQEEFKSVVQVMVEKTRKSQDHPAREFIDTENPELQARIEQWVQNVVENTKANIKNGENVLKNEDLPDLQANCEMFFDALATTMNTRSLEKDIEEFSRENKLDELVGVDQVEKFSELRADIAKRYPYTSREVDMAIEILGPKKNEAASLGKIVDTFKRVWSDYHMQDQTKQFKKVGAGYLLAKAAETIAPMNFQEMFGDNEFKIGSFLQWLGTSEIAEVIDKKVDIDMQRLLTGLDLRINERVSQSLFYQEFEFAHTASLGELFTAIEKGKAATRSMVSDTTSKLIPGVAGLGMSLGLLTKINPALGAVSFAGLPIMYKISKRQTQERLKASQEVIDASANASNRIETIKGGFEEARTSPSITEAQKDLNAQMNKQDEADFNRFVNLLKMSYVREIPFKVSRVLTGAVGWAMNKAGLISGGAVLATVIYGDRLNDQVNLLTRMYFDEYPEMIQSIEYMDKILGEYDKLDLPDGEKEQKRTAVSELPNKKITIENLSYKEILKDVNLEIDEGEFVVIAGESGAGKTTLLRNIAGLYKPDKGAVRIGGVGVRDIKKYGDESIYKTMSYCNQQPQIFADLTLRENLLLWTKEPVPDEEIKRVMSELRLEKFADDLDKKIENPSGGEKVRIGLARTLLKKSKIMLLDEPTASLDSRSGAEVRRIISEIHTTHPEVTIICVSHDDKLLSMGDRTIKL